MKKRVYRLLGILKLPPGQRLESMYQIQSGSPDLRRARPVPPPADENAVDGGTFLSLDEVTANHIRKALELSGGKVHGPGGAGELLGINPNTLRHRMRTLGVAFGREHRI